MVNLSNEIKHKNQNIPSYKIFDNQSGSVTSPRGINMSVTGWYVFCFFVFWFFGFLVFWFFLLLRLNPLLFFQKKKRRKPLGMCLWHN